jgi:hypothetical protein
MHSFSAARFDDLFGSLAQRRGFHEIWPAAGPRDQNKTLTAPAGAWPVTGRSIRRSGEH